MSNLMFELCVEFGSYIPVVAAYKPSWPYYGQRPYGDWNPANWYTTVVLPQPKRVKPVGLHEGKLK